MLFFSQDDLDVILHPIRTYAHRIWRCEYRAQLSNFDLTRFSEFLQSTIDFSDRKWRIIRCSAELTVLMPLGRVGVYRIRSVVSSLFERIQTKLV
jgi:hypothetical protein